MFEVAYYSSFWIAFPGVCTNDQSISKSKNFRRLVPSQVVLLLEIARNLENFEEL